MLDRTWYNNLHNDTGTGLDGSIWAKEDVDALMDAVDAELNRIDIALADPTIARTNVNNVWTFSQTFRSAIYVEPAAGDAAPRISLYDRDQPMNSRYWQIHAHLQQLRFWPLNDDQTASVSPSLVLDRGGNAIIPRTVYANVYVEQNRGYYLGFWQPFAAACQAPSGTPLSYVRSECGFSKVGQCVTARIHIQGISIPSNIPHIRISQVAGAGGASMPTWDQDLCRVYILGVGGEVGYLVAQGGWWEVYRLNGADFTAGMTVFVIGHSTYYV